jgi:DNA-binding transcriptional LysR family regulator
MTHSAVSQQMALLERQLGVPLVIRGPRGVELTDAGFVTEDYLSAQGLVAAGIGVSTVPRLALMPLWPDVAALPIGGTKPYRRIAAVRRKDAGHSPAALHLLDVLRDVSAELS